MARIPVLFTQPSILRPIDALDGGEPAEGPLPVQAGPAAAISGPVVADAVAAPPPGPSLPPPGPFAPPPAGVAYRSIDGSGNNLANPSMNQAGSDMTRIGPAHFSDGLEALREGPNARDISNIVVAGQGDTPNPQGLSGMMYAWGQFIDHDIDLMVSGGANIGITTQAGDPVFAGATISLTRTATDPATGEGTSRPAAAINTITGWLDGSMVYGSDTATAAGLRLADGHMKTSEGGNLPIVDGMFAAGDIRVAENPDLTALQTLFLREHNVQVDLLRQQHPDWTGDHLYEQARAIVTAEIQHITFAEFLPHLLGANALRAYTGYKPNVDASIKEEFAGAAYRFGHSIVSAEIDSVAENGTTLAAQDLRDVFFEPAAQFAATGDGADGLLRHLAGDLSNALDTHLVDDLRNFLFGPQQGQDLAAINIQRGRDLGLGTLNETRAALGLKAYTSFDQITHDSATAAALSKAYGGNIDAVDLWIGGLAEDAANGGMVGQTFGLIIARQFEALRDGDRFWYENQGFDQRTLAQINATSLSDIILRDTNTEHMQADAFVYYDRHSGISGGVAASDANAPQLVVGSDGRDTLLGGNRDDLLVAGHGNQTLTGGAGADVFVFDNPGRTTAVITDFADGVDHIRIDHVAGLTFRDVVVTRVVGGTHVSIGSAEITLLGVRPEQVTPGDFAFGG